MAERQGIETGQSKHNCHLNKYEELTSAKRKRKTAIPSPSIKQPTLMGSWTSTPQRSIDKAVMKYVVQGLQPFNIVEQEAFHDFVLDLVPNSKIMTRITLTSMIDDAAKQMKIKIIEAMKSVEHIATTTDCLSASRRSFIGVTAHWMDPESLKRCSVALACRRLRGSHTFDLLANALNDIHTEFEIRGKIVRTTTDNGSNFIKAFKVFGEDGNDNIVALVHEEDEEEEADKDEEEIEFVDVPSLLDEDDGFEFQLPKHQRCACHILNLIATRDASKAVSNDTYKKLYYSTFSKCNALWNKSSRSAKAAETVEDACSLQLVRPNATRWNSVFMAVERMLRIVKEKGEAALKVVCTDLKVSMFNPAELAFLSEYAAVMTPVAQATNILQAETNVQMGWLLPTVKLLKIKLNKIKLPLKYCKPLVDALQVGIEVIGHGSKGNMGTETESLGGVGSTFSPGSHVGSTVSGVTGRVCRRAAGTVVVCRWAAETGVVCRQAAGTGTGDDPLRVTGTGTGDAPLRVAGTGTGTGQADVFGKRDHRADVLGRRSRPLLQGVSTTPLKKFLGVSRGEADRIRGGRCFSGKVMTSGHPLWRQGSASGAWSFFFPGLVCAWKNIQTQPLLSGFHCDSALSEAPGVHNGF
ncbi:uncharacterized protein LOC143513741 [Brachyhypopomus gauderio]|uniref:uncharacterized protein LOC143513741 n=1 Tax=Brachyhypopomus gauderio TaxID=698409 RepID=UPI0040418EE1